MPFLLCFIIAAVVTEGVKEALGLGRDTARKAWEKSWDRAAESSRQLREATDRRLRAMRGHRVGKYAAFGVAASSWAARLAGRAGGRGLLFGARATGATVRALLLGTAAVAGAAYRGGRRGLVTGAGWYESYAAKRGKAPSGRAARLIDRLKDRASTVDSSATERPTTQPPAAPTPPVDEPPTARPMPGPTNPDPTTTSAPAAIADAGPVLEGEIVTTPTDTAPALGASPEVLGHETAIANLQARIEQANRAAEIAQMIENLQGELSGIANDMAGGQQLLTDQIGALGVTAPNMATAVEQLLLVAAAASPDLMLQTQEALSDVSAGLQADIDDLQARFGHAHETVVSEGINPAYLAG
ncbi:hypothetical protein [Micromonospora sp. NPDC047730]|uniref:hypothetical protein n=1 Tax=Micromonospora sp. NPDC047730 TaxID=3364253 RepID=UPI003724B2EC